MQWIEKKRNKKYRTESTDETTRMKRRSHLFKTKNDWIDLRSRLVEAPGAGHGDTGLEPPSGL